MGFDLFMAVVAIVAASLLTWRILRWYVAPFAASGDTPSGDKAPSAADSAAQAQPPSPSDATHDALRSFIIAAVLTIPALLINVLHNIILHGLTPSSVSSMSLPLWTANSWLQVIVITPVLFYCGTPIAVEGWLSLTRHAPDLNTLIAGGAGAAYIYSLALTIMAPILPTDPEGPYFGFAGLAVTLALLGRLLEMRALLRHGGATPRWGLPAEQWHSRRVSAPASVERYYRLTMFVVPTALIATTWAFALFIVFGPQPRLARAVVIGFSVLMVAGLALAATKVVVAWKLLHA